MEKKKIYEKLIKAMRITIAQMFLAICFISIASAHNVEAQGDLNQKIYLQAQDESFSKVLKLIEKQTKIRFVFSSKLIQADQKVNVNFVGEPLSTVLDNLLPPRQLGYEVVEKMIILKKVEGLKTSSNTILPKTKAVRVEEIPTVTVTGLVVDEKNEPLVGASVVLLGTTKGTLTDVNGNYKLELDDKEKTSSLVFTFVGYEPQTVAIDGQTVINIILKDGKALSEVVVVGYGQQKKVSVTNSVSTIKGSDLSQRVVSNVQQSLQGQAPGLTVIDQGGSPGRSATTMRVRGITTLGNSNEALVIVDGIEQQMTNINPNDIESVSILKDAASTAIYGSRAANGVILITTKRAKEGKLTVSYNGFYAQQRSVNNPQMDLPSYMKLQQVAYTNAKIAVPTKFTDAGIAEYIAGNASNKELYPDANSWFQTLLHVAPQSNHNVSISGGSDNIKARLSMRYQNQASILNVPLDYGSTLGDVRLNTDFALSKRIKISTDINYRNNYSLTPINEPEVFNRFIHGTLFATPQYTGALESQYPGITGTYGLSPQGVSPRIIAELDGTSKRWDENILSNIKGDYKIMEGLTFSSQYAIRIDNLKQKDFANSYKNVDLVKNITRSVLTNSLTETRNTTTEYTWNNFLTYEKDIAKNNIKALLGYSTINNVYSGLSAYRQNFYNNNIQSASQGANDGTKSNTGSDAQFGLKSYFGRINYSFADKYLFEANGRYDGSSRFTGNNVYSFFPSFSAGWRVTEEPFMKKMTFLDELKLRGSWGKTGNQSVGLYSFYQSLSSSSYGFNGTTVSGYSPSQLANKDITWETTTQYDFGFDALAFKGFSLSFDYYNKLTEGILLNLPIPATIGLNAPPQNAGKVENKGVELQLGYRNTGAKAIHYGGIFNIAANRNKVVSLAGTGPYISGSDIDPLFIIKEGYPINSQWGYKTAGLFKTDDEAKSYPTITTGRGAGDVKYLDLNGDGKIDANDRTVIGKSFPDFTYSFNGNVGYKSFDLSFFFQGAAGIDTRLSGGLAENGNNEGFVPTIVSTNYWTAATPDARFPRPLKRDIFNMYTADRLIVKGDYLRLKNIQLSYTLPQEIVSKVKMSQARVYVSATNVLTFSKLKEWGLDPEVSSGRATYYPQVSVWSVGANVQF